MIWYMLKFLIKLCIKTCLFSPSNINIVNRYKLLYMVYRTNVINVYIVQRHTCVDCMSMIFHTVAELNIPSK